MTAAVKVAGLVSSLGLDTLAVSVALGLSGIAPSDRFQVGLSFALFEGLMPLLGFFIGGAIGAFAGGWAPLARHRHAVRRWRLDGLRVVGRQ